MKVKDEPLDQTIMRKYSEMNKKYETLQRDYAGLEKEMAELQEENAKIKNEVARNTEKYQMQIAMLNEELTKLKEQRQNRELEKQQSQKSEENTEIAMFNQELAKFNGQKQRENLKRQENPVPIDEPRNKIVVDLTEVTEQNNEISAETMIMDVQSGQQQPQQNLGNNIDAMENANTTIKRELEDAEMQEADIDGQIKYAPVQIGKILKCNWPGCQYQLVKTRNFGYMRYHWRFHTGERPFVCQECGQSFALETSLRSHALIHTGEKPYPCDVCGRPFRNLRGMNEHKRTHTVEKYYECAECGKSFRYGSQLKVHERDHTGEKPYECVECGKSFKTSAELRKHRITHSNEKCKRKNAMVPKPIIKSIGRSCQTIHCAVPIEPVENAAGPSSISNIAVNASAQSNLVNPHNVNTVRDTIDKITLKFECFKCHGFGLIGCYQGQALCFTCCGHPECI